MRSIFYLLLMSCFSVFIQALPKNRRESSRTPVPDSSKEWKVYGARQLESIHELGAIQLNGTSVKGPVQVNGKLRAEKAEIESLQVTGQASLLSSVVNGQTMIQGSLIAHSSTFKGAVIVHTSRSQLMSCVVESILVKPDQWGRTPQVLELLNGTQVKGPIIFESGKGEVITMPDTELGPIQGGTIKVYRTK
jgi:hypothetical protein